MIETDSHLTEENRVLVRLWMTRMLVLLGGYKGFIEERGYGDDKIAAEIGLMSTFDREMEEKKPKFSRREALGSLKTIYNLLENQTLTRSYSEILDQNINSLSDILHLSKTDRKILEFTIVLYTEEAFSDVADYLGDMNFNKVCSTLATTLDVDISDVKNTLKNNGTLSRTSLVYIDHSYNGRLRGKLEVVSKDFAERMLMHEEEPTLLLKDIITKCTPSVLSVNDFMHIQSSIDILLPYLKRGLITRNSGINVLMYGAPGTGKSQLSRVIAEKLNVELYEIAREDNEGDPIDAKNRLRAFKAAQSIFSGYETILLFDEVEDIFDDGSSLLGVKSTASKHKSWINKVLEESAVPTLWLTNSVDCMDRAFLRRFDIVIEVTVPPSKQREELTSRYCQSLVPVTTIERIAASEHVTPAIVSRASKVIDAIKDEVNKDKRGALLERIVDSTLLAQGHSTISVANKSKLPDYYDPGLINSDIDLAKMANNIGKVKSVKLCLYGPPGTGKTAYAHWLANCIGLPLYSKKASDLVSPYIGETEQNIAKAFREAEIENAVLVIDEVDSFLQDRRNAQRSWEVTEVNEMLTQMESFTGVFIASTNLVDALDQASLRRFDIKTKFDYLKPEQALELLSKFCEKYDIEIKNDIQKQVRQLNVLTPGDFHVLSKRHRFQPFSDIKNVVKALRGECELKEEGKPKCNIGFVH